MPSGWDLYNSLKGTNTTCHLAQGVYGACFVMLGLCSTDVRYFTELQGTFHRTLLPFDSKGHPLNASHNNNNLALTVFSSLGLQPEGLLSTA
jgi:hypothetical protein